MKTGKISQREKNSCYLPIEKSLIANNFVIVSTRPNLKLPEAKKCFLFNKQNVKPRYYAVADALLAYFQIPLQTDVNRILQIKLYTTTSCVILMALVTVSSTFNG